MPRIAGVNIPENKRLIISLTYIYGIGNNTSRKICQAMNLDPNIKTSKLSNSDINEIIKHIESKYAVENDLRREVSLNIKAAMDLGSYIGLRHRRKLPVRGQRTHTNARTRKGKAKAIAGKKK